MYDDNGLKIAVSISNISMLACNQHMSQQYYKNCYIAHGCMSCVDGQGIDCWGCSVLRARSSNASKEAQI